MKRIRNFVLFFVAFTLLYACRMEGHSDITIVNHSDRSIAVQEQYPINPESEFIPLFRCGNGATRILPNSQLIIPNEDGPPGLGGVWESYFKRNKYLQFLIMDFDIYWEYHSKPCDIIRKCVPILHVYRLTLEDLERMDWKVVYPPVE
ncbi:hypothetical protein JCM6292_3357 [Bacteroides pyogenes JCM 6292]|uniref:Lipoprotein n=4 Tax=Bacteroides pyogenes TaxID=310300 RepID=W4PI75_9BACE|nr:hypothetical protein [Bacteroides pyogenes]GAE16859.1 hypothetical protein JCM6292_3357 [Bacteroides pyogenes JCM 6292]GAE19123.1 hypothetical protein JCM6294_2138 [Bacteroides pyogenes DSM 20611 = JCM 6294]